MSDEYITKEEIKKWRSSVEKITLEEYAARLGKKLQEEKKTNDLADMLYSHYNPMQSPSNYDTVTKLEKIDLSSKISNINHKPQTIKKAVDEILIQHKNETQIEVDKIETKESANNKVQETKTTEEPKKEQPVVKEKVDKKSSTNTTQVKEEKNTAAETKKTTKNKKAKETIKLKEQTEIKVQKKTKSEEKQDNSVGITFIKKLTDREEKVWEHFLANRGKIVFAKDLADLLELKRDYIYKYIKNLRSKMATDVIENADNGGFILN